MKKFYSLLLLTTIAGLLFAQKETGNDPDAKKILLRWKHSLDI